MPMKKLRNNKDFFAALIIFAICAIFGLQMLNIKNETDIKFPTFVLIALGVMLLILVVRVIAVRPGTQGKIFAEARLLNVAIGVAAIIVFVAVYSRVGFFTTAFLILNPLSLLLDPNFGKAQTPKGNAIVALKTMGVNLVILAVIYVAFHIFLNVPTPKGILI